MLQLSGGQLFRHPSLTDKVSIDGALGLYFGLSLSLDKCQDGIEWGHLIALHREFLQSHDYRFNFEDDAQLVPEFDYVLDLLSAHYGLAPKPSQSRGRNLEAEVSLWAYGVKAKHEGCYRAHLGWLTLRSLEAFGELSDGGRQDFCRATNGLNLPIIDHWCGRTDIKDWLAKYTPNVWGYAHQRCPQWDSPDGKGREQPGLDLLVALKAAYDL
jgi:hypothetical protein